MDYIQPSGTSGGSAADPWTDAVNYYGPYILKTLQEGGTKRVQQLYEQAQVGLKVPSLQLDQFVVVIDRMIMNRQLIVKDTGQSPGEAVVALPVPVPA